MVLRSPRQQLKEAKQIAVDHGCLVSEKGGMYFVYRKHATGVTYVGKRGTPASLRAFVCKVTGFK